MRKKEIPFFEEELESMQDFQNFGSFQDSIIKKVLCTANNKKLDRLSDTFVRNENLKNFGNFLGNMDYN